MIGITIGKSNPCFIGGILFKHSHAVGSFQITIIQHQLSFDTATSWKWKVYLRALELAREEKLDIGTLIRDAFKDEEMKARVKEVPAFARIVVEDVTKTPAAIRERRLAMGQINESNLIEDASSFYGQEFGCEVTVANESDPWIEDPAGRAKRAKPYRPAIYVE